VPLYGGQIEIIDFAFETEASIDVILSPKRSCSC
jgi:hypothetical protein